MRRYGLPPPKHEHGYCWAEIRSFMFRGLAVEFSRWIYGQTVVREDNGTLIYYPQDVISFVEGILTKARKVSVYD